MSVSKDRQKQSSRFAGFQPVARNSVHKANDAGQNLNFHPFHQERRVFDVDFDKFGLEMLL